MFYTGVPIDGNMIGDGVRNRLWISRPLEKIDLATHRGNGPIFGEDPRVPACEPAEIDSATVLSIITGCDNDVVNAEEACNQRIYELEEDANDREESHAASVSRLHNVVDRIGNVVRAELDEKRGISMENAAVILEAVRVTREAIGSDSDSFGSITDPVPPLDSSGDVPGGELDLSDHVPSSSIEGNFDYFVFLFLRSCLGSCLQPIVPSMSSRGHGGPLSRRPVSRVGSGPSSPPSEGCHWFSIARGLRRDGHSGPPGPLPTATVQPLDPDVFLEQDTSAPIIDVTNSSSSSEGEDSVPATRRPPSTVPKSAATSSTTGAGVAVRSDALPSLGDESVASLKLHDVALTESSSSSGNVESSFSSDGKVSSADSSVLIISPGESGTCVI